MNFGNAIKSEMVGSLVEGNALGALLGLLRQPCPLFGKLQPTVFEGAHGCSSHLMA